MKVVNGTYNTDTQTAVKLFQKNKSLSQTGAVDTATNKALKESTVARCMQVLNPGNGSSDVVTCTSRTECTSSTSGNIYVVCKDQDGNTTESWMTSFSGETCEA